MEEDTQSTQSRLKLSEIPGLLLYLGYTTILTYLFLSRQFPFEFLQPKDDTTIGNWSSIKEVRSVPKPFENYFPNRNRFVFDGIMFDSDFDGGNLHTARKVRTNHYEISVACDGQDTQYETPSKKAFFYFKLVVLKEVTKQTAIKITAAKLSLMQKRNIAHGMVPVYRVLPRQPDWRYIDTSLEGVNAHKNKMNFTFEIKIRPGDKEIFVATYIPYNYTDVYTIIDQLETLKQALPDLYFRRDVLTNSLQGRPIEMLTITLLDDKSKSKQNHAFEKYGEGELLGRLFPNVYYNYINTIETCEQNGSWMLPPPEFSHKKVVVISARVHPGEAPASHIMDGVLLKFFESFTEEETRAFLNEVVVLAIPMLNPDGVTHSFFRHDIRGKDLNRAYAEEDPEAFPVNFALNRLIDYYLETDRFYMFVDLHSHVNHDGFFIYSNSANNPEDYKDLRAFYDQMLDMCDNFMPEHSVFARNFASNELGKARLHLKHAKNLKHVYTIESGYFKGRPMYQRKRRHTHKSDQRPKIHADKLYQEDFRDIGRCIAQSIIRSWARIGRRSPYYSSSEY